MHYFIFPTKDTFISSGSNTSTTGDSERDQNFGQDSILEIKKEFFNDSFDYQTRALVQFGGSDFNFVSNSVVNGDIVNPKYSLRLYEAEGTQELSTEYTLLAQPISQSWDEGTGKFGDNPKVTVGCSWENRNNYPGSTAVTWSNADGTRAHGVATHSVSSSIQSFSNQSPDIEMNITDMTKSWLSGSGQDGTKGGGFENHGLLLRFSGSQETNDGTFAQLKFFSKNTHTIYPPKLEVKWDDHVPASGSNTGSLSPINVSGADDNYLYVKQLRDSYKETEKVKFRVGARKRYIQKDFSGSVQTNSPQYVPELSGSYSIVDVATGETIVPFKDIDDNVYSYLSCDVSGSYFVQWLNAFQPHRVYKILLKLTTDDNQEYIYDDDFEFKIAR